MNFIKAGALWMKDGKSGKYLSGTVEINGVKHKVFIQKNNYKKEARQPDYVVSLMQEEPQQSQAIDMRPVQASEVPYADQIPF